ncbi:MAG: hypothetical protein IKD77_05575 [Bacilli bacterium]|nr:hypothetical protein [Bacilli bacterium]
MLGKKLLEIFKPIIDNTNGSERKVNLKSDDARAFRTKIRHLYTTIPGSVKGFLVGLFDEEVRSIAKLGETKNKFDENIQRIMSGKVEYDSPEMRKLVDECLGIIETTVEGYKTSIAELPSDEGKAEMKAEMERIKNYLENTIYIAVGVITPKTEKEFDENVDAIKTIHDDRFYFGSTDFAREVVETKAIISKLMYDYDEKIRTAKTDDEKARLKAEKKAKHDELLAKLEEATELAQKNHEEQTNQPVNVEAQVPSDNPEIKPIMQFGTADTIAQPLPFGDLDEPEGIPVVPLPGEDAEQADDEWDLPFATDEEEPALSTDETETKPKAEEGEIPVVEEASAEEVTDVEPELPGEEQKAETEEAEIPEVEIAEEEPVISTDEPEVESKAEEGEIPVVEEASAEEKEEVTDVEPELPEEEPVVLTDEPEVQEPIATPKKRQRIGKSRITSEDLTTFADYEDYANNYFDTLSQDELRSAAAAFSQGKTPKGMLSREEFSAEQQRQTAAKEKAEMQSEIDAAKAKNAALECHLRQKDDDLAASEAEKIRLTAEVSTLRSNEQEYIARHMKDQTTITGLTQKVEDARADARRESELHRATKAELAVKESEALGYRSENETLQRRLEELEADCAAAIRRAEDANARAEAADARAREIEERYEQELQGLFGRLQGIKNNDSAPEITEPVQEEPKKAKHMATAAPKHMGTKKPKKAKAPVEKAKEETDAPVPEPVVVEEPKVETPEQNNGKHMKEEEIAITPDTEVTGPVMQYEVAEEQTPAESSTEERYEIGDSDNGGAMLGTATVTDQGVDVKWDFSLGQVAANNEAEALVQGKTK